MLRWSWQRQRPRDWVLAALAQANVVTANKALLAEHGEQLAQAAVRHGRVLAYEAAVAGAVPSSRRCARA